MELVQRLVQTVDPPSIALAKGVAHLEVDVAKVNLFEKLVLKDTSGKASGTKNLNRTRIKHVLPAHSRMFLPLDSPKELSHLLHHHQDVTELNALRISLVKLDHRYKHGNYYLVKERALEPL